MNQFAIEFNSITKIYKKRIDFPKKNFKFFNFFSSSYEVEKVIDDLSFSLKKGEKVALIGPNGSGKSTTLKILSGLSLPTYGSVRVLNNDLTKKYNRKNFLSQLSLVCGGRSKLWQNFTVIENFNLFLKIYGIDKDQFEDRLSYLIKEFQVENFLYKPIQKLSLGQKMKCELIASLLHKPKILFLDEPTIGLDIKSKIIFRELIKKIVDEDLSTLIVTSHEIADIESICDRMIFIKKGKLIIDDKINSVKKEYIKTKKVIFTTKEKIFNEQFDGVEIVSQSFYTTELRVHTSIISIQNILSKIVNNYTIQDLTIEDPTLEEIIINKF